MCTVTFIPKGKTNFILTSNRDEAPGRETLPPDSYKEEGVKLLYPKDKVAGGTWIGISDKKRVACIMNGGFVPHERKACYGRSRGLIVKDLLIADDLQKYLETYDFSEIEPFTVLIVSWQKEMQLLEVVWDGLVLHPAIKPLKPQIWSSSPLYSPQMKTLREQWFSAIGSDPDVDAEKILDFHFHGGEGDSVNNLVMDRGFVKTKSITQVLRKNGQVTMEYHDLQSGKTSVSAF